MFVSHGDTDEHHDGRRHQALRCPTQVSPLVIEILQGKTTVAEASRQFDLTASEIDAWIDNAKAGMGTP